VLVPVDEHGEPNGEPHITAWLDLRGRGLNCRETRSRTSMAACFTRGEEPLDRDQLTTALRGSTAAPKPRRTLRALFSRWEKRAPAITWLPTELLPVEDDSDLDVCNPPLIPASRFPVGLRTEL
jgi:hypothetical protein